MPATALTRLLGIDHPIIQAPMASATTPDMVAAVSTAGGLGSLGGAYHAPDALRVAVDTVRQATARPFGVNLFVPQPTAHGADQLAAANRTLAPLRDELGIEAPTVLKTSDHFDDQLAVLIERRVPVVTFHFGLPGAAALAALRDGGIKIGASATRVADGRALAEAGVDFIIAQGIEAGGHQGTFAPDMEPAGIGLMALVPAMVDAVKMPVVAAGGIMDGRGIAAALCLGAGAAQLGTAFLACPESMVPEAHKRAVLGRGGGETVITRGFSGRPARGYRNRFTDHMAGLDAARLPFPHQNALTGDIRVAARTKDDPEFMSLWAGQGGGRARELAAGDLLARLVAETETALKEVR